MGKGGRPAGDPVERFWSKVEKTDGCWLWRGELNSAGYGKIKIEGRYWLAHRYAIVLRDGMIPDELHVCHQCDTPRCVRFDHLFLGTSLDNARDMSRKHRGTGDLTKEQVRALRHGEIAGNSTREWAASLGVSTDTVRRVIRAASYRESDDPIEF